MWIALNEHIVTRKFAKTKASYFIAAYEKRLSKPHKYGFGWTENYTLTFDTSSVFWIHKDAINQYLYKRTYKRTYYISG